MPAIRGCACSTAQQQSGRSYVSHGVRSAGMYVNGDGGSAEGEGLRGLPADAVLC